MYPALPGCARKRARQIEVFDRIRQRIDKEIGPLALRHGIVRLRPWSLIDGPIRLFGWARRAASNENGGLADRKRLSSLDFRPHFAFTFTVY